MRNGRLDELQAGIKIARRNVNNLSYVDDITLKTESEKELKKPLDEGERGEWKSQLKTKLKKKTKTTASGPITSWQIEGRKVKAVTDSSSWALKSLQMVTEAVKLQDNCFLAWKLWQT